MSIIDQVRVTVCTHELKGLTELQLFSEGQLVAVKFLTEAAAITLESLLAESNHEIRIMEILHAETERQAKGEA